MQTCLWKAFSSARLLGEAPGNRATCVPAQGVVCILAGAAAGATAAVVRMYQRSGDQHSY